MLRRPRIGVSFLSASCRISLCLLLLGFAFAPPIGADDADEADETDEAKAGSPIASGLPVDEVPDVRDDESKITVQKGDFVVFPIPLSSPTFGTGLIIGGAYFYPQTAEQKASQPASFTGAAGVYTTNASWAGGIAQQNYWGGDTWRFSGVAGYVDFKFVLRDPATDDSGGGLDWDVKGGISQATLSRRIVGDWYVGVLARYLNITQDLEMSSDQPGGGVESKITSVGAGLTLQYDTRDVPTNAYQGRRLEAKAIFSRAKSIETSPYQSYALRFRSYHQLDVPLVIAWDVNTCARGGTFPLWDTCRLNLRGFALTDYLGKQSITGQIEARWRAFGRWGFVAFAGAGQISDSFSAQGESERVPSYGAGVRFMVLKSNRINLRVDYARSDNSDAWYISVGEAF
jgi:hypothetical protein